MRYFLTIFLVICWNTSFAATYEDGYAAYKSHNYSQAYLLLMPLAEQGDAKAQNYIGFIYEYGKGVQENTLEAIKWYRLAAEQGYAAAQYNLARLHSNKNIGYINYSEALKWYRLAAEQGYSNAQNNLADLYSNKNIGYLNYDEAVKWYRLAAENGQANAEVSLGWYYMNGFENLKINQVNYEEAKYWNELGAKNGCAEGYNNLGWLYENGLGVTKNHTKAAELYEKAVTEGIKNGANEKNLEEAQTRLKNIKFKLIDEVKLESNGGVFECPIILNDVLKINVIIDSGAAEVSISPDVVMTLIRAKTINVSDFLPGKIYTFADGSKTKSMRFNLRSLKIGNKILYNIECRIANSLNSPMLLGQSALKKLGKYTIDYKKGTLEFK